MVDGARQLADASVPGGQNGDPAALCCGPATEAVPDYETRPGQAVDPCLARLRLLVSAVEAQIIPRLVLAHRPGEGGGAASGLLQRGATQPEDVEHCARLLLAPGGDALVDFAERLRARGVSLDTIYLDVFAAAARRLGDLWSNDECSFTDVTIALGRLQRVLRHFAAHFRPEAGDWDPWRRALFAPGPGEQHTFGLSMVVQFFLRAGWDATLMPFRAEDELFKLVRQDPIALVGLSLSCEERAPALKSLIGRLRLVSRNVGVKIVVGGFAFANRPDLEREVGADGTATDGAQAVSLAQRLLLSPHRLSG